MNTNTAAPTQGAPDATALQAELDRRDELQALGEIAGMAPAQVQGWVRSGAAVATVREELAAQRRATAQPSPRGTTVHGVHDRELDRPFTFGEQLVAIVKAGRPGGRVDPRLRQINDNAFQIDRSAAVSGMNESIGSEGGFFIAPELLPGIIEPVYQEDPILSRVTRLHTSKNSVTYNVIDETSRANGSRWGGIQMYWAAEGGTVTPTFPKLRQMTLVLKKLMGIAYLTDELDDDAPAAQSLLTSAFSAELSFMLADGIFRGLGAGQMLGFMKAGCTVTQAIEATQTIANTPQFISLNIPKMLARVPASLWSDTIWLYNQELLPYLLNAVTGTNGVVPVFMAAGGLSARPYDTILGRPAFASELCEAVGTPGDIVCVAPSQYHMLDKGAPTTATSLHVRFLNDENTLRITYRVDGQPVWKQAITPYKGAATRSPFVMLNTRA